MCYLICGSWFQVVVLLAVVGLLDAFRVLLVGPVLDRVFNPSSGSDNIRLFTIPDTNHAVYLQQFVPCAFAQRVDNRGLRAGRVHCAERYFRLRGHLSGELRRLRHDHRLAQRSLRLQSSPVGRVLPEAYDGHAGLDDYQRYRARAVCHVDRPGGVPAAVVHVHVQPPWS